MDLEDCGVSMFMSLEQLRRVRATYELAHMKLEDRDYKERLVARGNAVLWDAMQDLSDSLPAMIAELDRIIKRAEVYARKQKELTKELENLE